MRRRFFQSPDDHDDLLEREQRSSSAMQEAAFFLLITVILLMFGLLMLYSATYTKAGINMFLKQLIWAGIGGTGFAATVLLGHRFFCMISPLLMVGLVIMLLLPLTVMRTNINGAYRWIVLGPFQIQPSEFAKLVLILFWADFLSRRPREIEHSPFKKILLPLGLTFALVGGLVFAGKDLGTTLLLAALFYAVVLFASGISFWYPAVFGALGALGIVAVFNPVCRTFLTKIGLLPAYRLGRLESFQNPELYEETIGFQLVRSQLALGSGNWFGLGLTESKLKREYLPEKHTDFILSVVGEELGFASMIAVMLLYILMIATGFLVSLKARTRQGMLLAFGVSTLLGLQAFINIGVICGALPTKGMPAPFISYGGSSLITCLTAVGLVFSVALDKSYPDYPELLRQKTKNFFRKDKKSS